MSADDPVRIDREHFEAIPVAAFASAPDGRIVAWNGHAQALLGVPAAEACGARCADVVAGRAAGGEPVCSTSCPLVRELSRWLGTRSPDGRRDWRPADAPRPAAHPGLVTRDAFGREHDLDVHAVAALLDGEPVLVHLLGER